MDSKEAIAPIEDEDNKVITVKLSPQDGGDVVDIKAKKKTKVQRLIDAYASQRGIDAKTLRLFTPDGNRMNSGQTLAELQIEDGDQIEVMMTQLGGC
eukprot:TRINITY_DN5674_c0_g1_i1.p2 TRINITY_DN5674_c0_g1~~TRINITY_DN5674_c0_g1_i1.p2  ORF type:complete len:107 (-),score=32.18 TRINITY_DN5674_c0_g1_i1:772-1062(-)